MSGKYRIAIGSGMALALLAGILVKTLLPGPRLQSSAAQPEIPPKDRGADAAARLDLDKIRRKVSENPEFLGGIGLEKSTGQPQRTPSGHPYLFLPDEDNSWLAAVSVEQKALLLPTMTPGQHAIPGNSLVMGYRLTEATTLSISYNKKSGAFDGIGMKRYFSE